jgi:uncharacterized protein involved in outer membrane biogenesis
MAADDVTYLPMTNELNVSAPAKKRRGWLRIVLGAILVLLVLIVAAYFVVTSAAFLKSAVLPRVSKAIGADVTVSDAAIHPFSEIDLSNLKVQAGNQPPLVTAPEIRVRYHLWDILRGNLRVDEIALVSPTVALVQNPDGTSNLDPLLKALQAKPSAAQPAQPAKTSKPPQIDLRSLTLTDATILQIRNYAGGQRDVLELTNVNLTLTNLQNGQTASLQLAATLRVAKNPPADAAGALEAGIKGEFQFSLTPDLKPGAVTGNTHLDISGASGAFKDFSGFSAALDCDATPAEIRQLDLHFQKSGESLGELSVAGPLDLQKMEGQLQVKLQGVDRRLLNLAGAGSGIDFDSTAINSTNEITLTKAGAAIAATGRFNADKFQVTRAGQTTPTLDFSAEYSVTVDSTARTALLRELKLTGTQDGRPLLAANLSQPMNLAWGNSTNNVGDSALELDVTKLNLADWRPFLGNTVSSGDVNVTLKMSSQQAGKQLGFDLNSQINDLVARVGSNQTFQASVNLLAQGQVADFKQINLSKYQLQIVRQNQPLLTASGSGAYNVADASADAQVALQTSLPGLGGAFPLPGANFSSGTVDLSVRVTQKQNTQTVTSKLTLADLTGQFGTNAFSKFGSTVDVDASRTPEQVQIQKLHGTLTQGGNTAASFDVSGSYNPSDASADAQVALQASLAALCKALPQPNASCSSGSIELKGHVTQKANTQTVTGQLVLADLTGKVDNNSFSKFGSTMDVDASRTPEQIQIKKLNSVLAQNGIAGGSFNLTGSYDPTNQAAQLNVALSGFNQDGLRPFLEPLLAGKKLVSIAINGNASVQYDPSQSSAIKADLQVTNLVVNDPTGQFPATPLAVGLQIDTTLQKQSADIRQFQISLTPTSLAQNQIQLQGQVDFAQPKAIQGNLKLSSDSLDLTRYYDLFAGGTNVTRQTPSPSPSQPETAAGSQEPAPVTLPTQNFTVTASINRLFLREVAITNFQTTVKLETHRVTIKPFQLALNGAPVNATVDVDLSVPGYKYSLGMDASQIPFAPLVNSFAPDRKGELGGALTAHAQINGAGVTGANLQKNLAGQFDIGATNLSLSVINVHSAILKSLINVVATLPQLLSNPETAIVSIFSRVTGQSGGLVDELQKAPIEIVAVRGQAGTGRVTVQQATVQSAAFEADAPGDIVLAPVLTNSTINFPVTLSLSQSIAKELNLSAASSTAGSSYVPLPQFLTMTGTLGDPQKQINKGALVGLTVKSLGSGLLNHATNAVPPVENLLNNLFRRAR